MEAYTVVVSPLRVLLVDDSPSVRAVVRRFLTADASIELVGEAPDGEAAVEAAARLRPDMIVMDLQMPVLDGLVAIERIMAARPVPIIVLSSRANRNLAQTAFEAMRRGALEVLPKPEDTDSWRELATSLPRVLHGVTRSVDMRPRNGRDYAIRMRSFEQAQHVIARLEDLDLQLQGSRRGVPDENFRISS